MKRFQKDGPKRRRWTRRETSPVSRQGYLPGVENFKTEREARRAGITGKVDKHDRDRLDVTMYGDPVHGECRPARTLRGVIFIGDPYPWQEWLALQIIRDLKNPTDAGASASGERERPVTTSREQREEDGGGEREE